MDRQHTLRLGREPGAAAVAEPEGGYAEGAKRYADDLADKVFGGSLAAAASSVGKRGDR
jgi:hypothetical protein